MRHLPRSATLFFQQNHILLQDEIFFTAIGLLYHDMPKVIEVAEVVRADYGAFDEEEALTARSFPATAHVQIK